MQRKLDRIEHPALKKGFAGPGHQAKELLMSDRFIQNDPFILLMDDRISLNGELPNVGPHPHAGFETVTLILEGNMHYHDQNGEGSLGPGDLQWMTAGSGVVHAEKMDPAAGDQTDKVRILQLWLTLPQAERWVAPAVQDVRGDALPVRREPGAELRLYSGTSGEISSSTRNHVPVTLADIRLEPHASITQLLDRTYNGFLYVLEGQVQVGDQTLTQEAMGWLDRPTGTGDSELEITAAENGARVLLYAGQMQHQPIVHHGPFVGDTREDIVRAFENYHAGRMSHINSYK